MSNFFSINPRKWRIRIKMRTDTQQLIIIILGILAIISILKNYDMIVLSTIIGILGGFLTGKTLTEKQQEIITQQTLEECGDDVQ